MNTPRPNPARFDGHWLPPRQMAALLGIKAPSLGDRADRGSLPPGSVTRTLGGHRRYEAGAILKAARKDWL